MPYLVVDTSAVLAVLLEEPTRPALLRATEGYGLVGAPSLPWEVGNALVAGVRRRRLSAKAVYEAWASYQVVPVRLADIDPRRALQAAVELDLYAYDGYVLETARAERLPLLTLDGELMRAAKQLDLRLAEFEHEGL
jgi:predicted nucleic acid-binding protein